MPDAYAPVAALVLCITVPWERPMLSHACVSFKLSLFAMRCFLGGREFSMSTDDLIVYRTDTWCLLGLRVVHFLPGDDPAWYLGDVFLRKYYVQFDWGQKRLGIALSRA